MLAVLSTGCVDEWFFPNAVLTPVANDELETQWREVVDRAALQWNIRLQSLGCEAPFVVGDGGNEVILVPRARWSHGDSVVGLQTDDTLEIRGDSPTTVSSVLMHEMGHAMGLDHVDRSERPSVMNAIAAPSIYDEDVAQAALAMGCVAD